MNKTPEEIAREAAGRLVEVEHIDRGPGYDPCRVRCTGWLASGFTTECHADEIAGSVREEFAALIADAIRLYAAQPPLPCDMTAQRLAEIRQLNDDVLRWGHTRVTRIIYELLAHIDFLHRIFNGPEAEACREAYERGRRLGAERQREACVRQKNEGFDVETTPLVTDKEQP